MNKLLTKIVGVALGASMAIGVGVAVVANSGNDMKQANADSTTYTFTSKSWADSTSSWTSDKDGGQLSSGQGVQVTTTYSGAGAHTKSSISNISEIEFTYCTNATKGVGSISVTIGTNSAVTYSVTKSGGTTARTTKQSYATPQTGVVTFTVTCTQNSIYVAAVKITTSGGGGGGGGGGSFEPDHAGTYSDPYSVSDALGLTESYSSTQVDTKMSYVKGVVSELDEDNVENNGYFYISDGTNTFFCDGVAGTSVDKSSASYVGVGYEVVVHGYLQKYEDTQMIAWDDDDSGSECYLYSVEKAGISSFTASVSGTHYAYTKLTASDFTTTVSYTNGPTNIAVPDETDLEWMVGETVDGELQPGSNTVTLFYWTEDVEISVTGTEVHATDISFSAETYTMGKNSTLTLSPTVTPANTTDKITWTSSDTSVAEVSQLGVVSSSTKTGSTTITATINGHTDTCEVRVKNVIQNTDEITLSTTSVSGTGYTSFSGKSASNEGHSEAVYAGKIAGGNSSIQLNTNATYGFVCTTSGGNLKSITIEWESHTINTRSVNILAKNSAYASASDLDSDNTKGTQVTNIGYSASASTYTFEDTYTYFGIKAVGGALYISKITVVWESADETKTISSVSITSQPTKTSYAVGETLDVTGMVLTATYEEEDVDDAPVLYKVYDGATEITTDNKYTFTDTDYTNGSKQFTVKATDDETKTATLTISTITPAYPMRINVGVTARWTDTQTLAGGYGRWTVVFSDESHNVTNVKIGDTNTSFEIGGVAVDTSALAKNYDGQTGTLKYTDPTTNITVTKSIDINVTAELSVDSFEGIPDYILISSSSDIITANFTSMTGEPDSYSVVSSNPSKLTVSFDPEMVDYNSTSKTGSLMFTVTSSSSQGQYNVTVSVTKGSRTESKSVSILVRSEDPAVSGVQYERVTSLDDVTAGNYIIAANVGGTRYALTGVASGKIGGSQVTVTNDVISEENAGTLPVEILKNNEGNYAVGKSGLYFSLPSSGTDFSVSSSANYYSLSVSNGIFKINGSGRGIVYRTSTTNKWAPYANSNINETEYYGFELYKEVSTETEKTSFDLVKDFVDGYMYMDQISITDKGSGACQGENGLYLTAKRAWNAMQTAYEGEDNLVNVFQTNFADAYARYMAWASACGDSAPFEGTTIQSINRTLPINLDNSSVTILVVAVSVLSFTTLGAYFFLRKKKEEN